MKTGAQAAAITGPGTDEHFAGKSHSLVLVQVL